HVIEYRSTDNAGNVESLQTATVRIDTTPPSGALTAPADGAHINGNVAISASAGDASAGVASVEFLVRPNGSGSFTTISTDTSAPYDASWDSTSAPEGNADLEVVVVDNAWLSITSAVRTVAVTDPPSGAVVGGPNVHLAATALDLGSGVGSVRFEQRPAGGGSFTAIGTDTTDPYEASWDTTGLSGDYELRAVATDAAGNPGNSAVVPVTVDATAPSVTLVDPGALLRDVVNLAASTQSVAVASVAFDRRPSGGGSWTRIQLDATRPWGAAFDTKGVADGLYELRAQALDSTGHVLASHSRDGIRIDNTAPRVQSATPADGAVVGAAKSIVLVASEPVASIQGASLDGAAATATISGSTVTFSTGPLGAGE